MSGILQVATLETTLRYFGQTVNTWILDHPAADVTRVSVIPGFNGTLTVAIWYRLKPLTKDLTKTADLTEDEAWEAMKQGHIVTNGVMESRLERDGDDWRHFRRFVGESDESWTELDRQRWRIVPQPTDERPTREDVAECIRDSWLINAPETEIQAALNVMEVRWPAMFREEDAE